MTQLRVALVNQERVLLVSLWGEYNAEGKDEALLPETRRAKLQNVITFVEKLRVWLKVDGVLMGGSFNLQKE